MMNKSSVQGDFKWLDYKVRTRQVEKVKELTRQTLYDDGEIDICVHYLEGSVF